MPGPGRPKEHPERRLRSPEAATDAFLARHRELQVVVNVALATSKIIEWLRYIVAFDEWKLRYDAALSLIETPPPLPQSAIEAANSAGGEHLRKMTDQFQRMSHVVGELFDARALFASLPSFSVPDLREFEDQPFMMAVLATWMASELGNSLDPLDILLLLVAARIDPPTTDEGEYEKRSDRWRKRMPRVRVWSGSLNKGFERKPSLGPIPAQSGRTGAPPSDPGVPPESE